MHKFFAVLLCLLMGAACYRLARRKGRHPYLWFMLGLLFGIFALIIIALLPPARSRIRRIAPQATPPSPKKPPLEALHEAHTGKLWYYLTSENEQHGPMSLNALGNAWMDGKIHLSTYVWHEDLTEWRPLQEVLKPL